MEPQQSNYKIKLFIILFFLTLGVVMGYLVLTSRKSVNSNPTQIQPTVVNPILSTTKKEGSMMLSTSDNVDRKPIGTNFSVDLWVDSNGKDITGYDAVVSYDKTKLDLVSAASDVPDVTLYKRDTATSLVITGVKTLASTATHVWVKTKIATLVFHPKIKGNFTLSVAPSDGRSLTKMVNVASKVLYPMVSSLAVEIF